MQIGDTKRSKVVTTREISLPWGLVGLLALALVWALMVAPADEVVGTVNLGRIVDESARAQHLNQLLSERYNELITRFDLGSEPEEDDVDRANREREAYAEYLSYRLELETQFQSEVDAIVREVAKREYHHCLDEMWYALEERTW